MNFPHRLFAKLSVVLGIAMLTSYSAHAQDSKELVLELNKVEPSQNSCVLTFLVSSKMATDIDKLAYEFVIFDNQFRVDRMTVFDFRELKAGKFRVRQFQLPDTPCEKLGRILINDVSSCTGNGVDNDICSEKLSLSNKTNIEFLN